MLKQERTSRGLLCVRVTQLVTLVATVPHQKLANELSELVIPAISYLQGVLKGKHTLLWTNFNCIISHCMANWKTWLWAIMEEIIPPIHNSILFIANFCSCPPYPQGIPIPPLAVTWSKTFVMFSATKSNIFLTQSYFGGILRMTYH